MLKVLFLHCNRFLSIDGFFPGKTTKIITHKAIDLNLLADVGLHRVVIGWGWPACHWLWQLHNIQKQAHGTGACMYDKSKALEGAHSKSSYVFTACLMEPSASYQRRQRYAQFIYISNNPAIITITIILFFLFLNFLMYFSSFLQQDLLDQI